MTVLTSRQKATICSKLFISAMEIKNVLDLKEATGNKVIHEIRAFINCELEKRGKKLPDTKHFPTDLVFKYLKMFGITKQQIINNAKVEIALDNAMQ